MELVEDCDFFAWQDRYRRGCCDGTYWDLKVMSGNRTLREICGENRWPDQWTEVVRLLRFCHSPVNLFNGLYELNLYDEDEGSDEDDCFYDDDLPDKDA